LGNWLFTVIRYTGIENAQDCRVFALGYTNRSPLVSDRLRKIIFSVDITVPKWRAVKIICPQSFKPTHR
jgi:hypothetical protein